MLAGPTTYAGSTLPPRMLLTSAATTTDRHQAAERERFPGHLKDEGESALRRAWVRLAGRSGPM